MSTFHKILVATDFSPHSAEALRVAVSLSKLCAAPLTILAVYQPEIYPLVPDGALFPRPEDVAADVGRISERLLQLKTEASAAGAIEVATSMRQGPPFSEIIAAAREAAADLVVVGTHGRTGLKHALLGSVAEKVVRKAPCAVLTVRLPDQRFEHP
jgi:universal stress protein A